ncbi:hypothetical protein MKLM6_1966 [Methylomonas koyamae]|nr:hypothetical protein MKLM6_1966 [Methylomonas koyamae]
MARGGASRNQGCRRQSGPNTLEDAKVRFRETGDFARRHDKNYEEFE